MVFGFKQSKQDISCIEAETMNIETDNLTLVYLLGYLTTEQWVDALHDADLGKDVIEELLNQVDNLYPGVKRNVDEYIKEKVIERLRG